MSRVDIFQEQEVTLDVIVENPIFSEVVFIVRIVKKLVCHEVVKVLHLKTCILGVHTHTECNRTEGRHFVGEKNC